MGLVAVLIPDSTSNALNVVVTFSLFHPFALGSGLKVAVITGGVLSIFTAGDVNVAVLPAPSVRVTIPVKDGPSVVSASGLGTDLETTPDKSSAAVKLSVTFVLFQPPALGAGVGVPKVSVGGVLSILNPFTTTGVLTFPALSVHVPDADRPLPSPSNVMAPVQTSIPDNESVPAKEMVTFVLFQPLAFGLGDAAAVAAGVVV